MRTLTFRLTLAVSLCFSLSTIALFGLIYWQITRYEEFHLGQVLTTGLQQLAGLPEQQLSDALDAWQAATPSRLTEATLFGPKGTAIRGWPMQKPPALPIDGRVHRLKTQLPNGVRAIALAAAVRRPDGSTLLVQRSLDVLLELRYLVIRALALGVVPLTLFSLAAGTLLSLRTTRRLRQMHEVIDRIMRGNLTERLPGDGTRDDLDRLTRSLNSMLDEIERLIGEIKSVGDNIAHDLRTPLARMRMRLELNRNTVQTPQAACALIDACLTDLDATFSLVAALLRIAEIEAGRRRAKFIRLDLGSVAEEVGEIYAPIAAEQDQALTVEREAAPPVLGDHDLMVEALANLVHNAIKFTPRGGAIVIRVLSGPILQVVDDGPGVPAPERDKVLQRFYRVDKSRRVPGHGLGLNIVSAIAGLHDFRLVIGDGPGGVFTLDCRDVAQRSGHWMAAAERAD